ncbi:MAG TPA: DUF58 domain-containing protein [Acidimicrobiales bacterium]|nr:DUF58 domain-containing protein [Acidimicrobiales bacterium]
MLTRRGWGTAIAAAMLAVAGRMLGLAELYALAVGFGAMILVSAVIVSRRTGKLSATRAVVPSRVHVDGACRVDVVIHNAGQRRSGLANVRESFDGGRRAAGFLLAPIEPGASARGAYRLPTDRRGIFDLGPLVIERLDALGLVARAKDVVPATKLTVYPKIVRIVALPHSAGEDPLAGSTTPTAIGQAGDDFFALRPYEIGDDLRRVHWPSVARTGEMVIRQNELPWQGRVTVVVDLRDRVHTPASLEDVLSAAASIVTACAAEHSLVRLITTARVDTGFGAGRAHVDGILERLAAAALHPAERGALGAIVHAAGRARASSGAACVITTRDGAAEVRGAPGGTGRRAGVTTVVFAPPQRAGARKSVDNRGRLGPVVEVGVSTDGFASAWNAAFALEARRARRRRTPARAKR